MLPDLPDRLKTMLDSVAADRVMLLVGGGRSADLVRSWDEIHRLDTDASHWLAIDSLTLTAKLLTTLLPEAELASDRAAAERCWQEQRIPVLDPRPILEAISREAGQQLPAGWHCTSDSIAAWVATHWRIGQLVLAKSTDLPVDATGEVCCSSDAVDECFASIITEGLSVQWCNVRRQPDVVTCWTDALSRDSGAS